MQESELPGVKLELMGVPTSPHRQAAAKCISYGSVVSPVEPSDQQWWRSAPSRPLHSLSLPPAPWAQSSIRGLLTFISEAAFCSVLESVENREVESLTVLSP